MIIGHSFSLPYHINQHGKKYMQVGFIKEWEKDFLKCYIYPESDYSAKFKKKKNKKYCYGWHIFHIYFLYVD